MLKMIVSEWVLICLWWNKSLCTVNNKSFEGEKFRGLLGSSGMRGKVSRFFPSPPSYIHGFPTLQNSYERFNENFAFLRWILLKTVISILGNGREYITDTRVCRFHAFQDDHAVTGGEELQWKWVRGETDLCANRFLVSFFCKLLPNFLAETL